MHDIVTSEELENDTSAFRLSGMPVQQFVNTGRDRRPGQGDMEEGMSSERQALAEYDSQYDVDFQLVYPFTK